MKSLFETEPVIDRHITGIIAYILTALPNNNPKKDSKCYLRAVNYITELYNGNFHVNKRFDTERDGQFDTEGVFEKISSCKHDWAKVRELIQSSLEHLEQSKKPEKMPWNKKYVNSITFARFFVNGYNINGEVDSPFLHFVNPPKDSYAFTSDITIGKLKDETLPLIKEQAEKFCKKYFKMKNYQLAFWYDMEDWTRWLKNFKKSFSSVYGEFINCCDDGNPFTDFKNYLMSVLKVKEGDHPVMNHWYFKLTYNDGTELAGYFKQWLGFGMSKGKFAILKQLPKSVDSYYTDESFSSKKSDRKKKVIEMEDVEW